MFADCFKCKGSALANQRSRREVRQPEDRPASAMQGKRMNGAAVAHRNLLIRQPGEAQEAGQSTAALSHRRTDHQQHNYPTSTP